MKIGLNFVEVNKIKVNFNKIEDRRRGAPAGALPYSEFRYIIIRSMARKCAAGPASDPEVLILSSLADGPKHGYAIMLDISRFSGTELGPGTLYSAITRLVDNGWIEPEEAHGRQRPYRLAPRGLQHLQAQLESMRHLSNLGLRRLRTA